MGSSFLLLLLEQEYHIPVNEARRKKKGVNNITRDRRDPRYLPHFPQSQRLLENI